MEVIIKRSKRRKKTIQARMIQGKMEVLAPAHISDGVLQDHISRLKARMAEREYPRSDEHLQARASLLNQKYFCGTLNWNSICYSPRQEHRRGSCSVNARTIRISERLAKYPQWVEDYVIVHELAHLLEPNHGKEFKALVRQYPLAERAIGFLMATEALDRRPS
ncbi:MAG: M48 family metallopeptidase [Methanothrix sp.]|jgi:predicted metal-dependent hydrolase|nr:M48 family metallopeptidase [Methanothrix sp.]